MTTVMLAIVAAIRRTPEIIPMTIMAFKTAVATGTVVTAATVTTAAATVK